MMTTLTDPMIAAHSLQSCSGCFHWFLRRMNWNDKKKDSSVGQWKNQQNLQFNSTAVESVKLQHSVHFHTCNCSVNVGPIMENIENCDEEENAS